MERLGRACALVTVVALGGCGGGGGGGASGPGPASVTGLIPSPPAKGAILYDDARTVRPLRAGATWTYRGQYKSLSVSTPIIYATQTQHVAAATGVVEVGANVDNAGPQSVSLNDAGGTVVSTAPVDFTGTPQTVASIELRSPLQVGDQYTVFDQRFADAGIDVDGDGKPDALDVAIWTRVVGTQTLTFRNIPALDTVEVDTYIAVRLLPSTTGQWTTPQQGVMRVWYAPGIGVVRRSTDIPNETGTDRTTTDEWLVSWDAQTEGYGAMDAVRPVMPAGGPMPAGTALLGGPALKAAFAFSDHAVVVTNKLDPLTGSVIARLDLRGNLVSFHDYPHDRFIGRPFAAHANGFVYVDSAPNNVDAVFRQFDSDGAEKAPSGLTVDLGGGRFLPTIDKVIAAGDGSTIWLAWARTWVNVGVGFVRETVLRGYDVAGNPLTPEFALLSNTTLDGITASGGRVLVTLTSNDGNGNATAYYASAMPQSAFASVVAAPLPGGSGVAWPVLFDTGGALFFTDVSAGTAVSSGVRLDGAFTPVFGPSGAWSGEVLAGVPLYGVPPSATGGTAALAGTAIDALWPEDPQNQSLMVAAWYPPTASALSLAVPRVVRTPGRFDNGSAQLAFPDRLMLFGSDGSTSGLAATVVWLR